MKLLPFKMPKEVELMESGDNYGKFLFSPLEPGFGITLGNALRRTLLGSIQGSAISGIKINGVLHEFSTIPGVLEDVPEIIRNLKSVNLRLINVLEKKYRLDVKKKGKILASHIQTDNSCEIKNPDQLILTVTDKAAPFIMDLTITSGRGYIPAELFRRKEAEIGVIFLDTFYSPVKRVNYKIDHTRIEHRTDYDKLIVEIWTNGILLPQDALSLASTVLNDHFAVLAQIKKEEDFQRLKEMDEAERKLRETLKIRIDGLELSVRADNCLKAAKIETLGDLVKKTEAEMLQYPNFGRKSLNELIELLEKYSLKFGMEFPKGFDDKNKI